MKLWHHYVGWFVLFVLVALIVVGCSGLAVPTVGEAPYKIKWVGESYGTVYCDNYELGSSVVIDGYWEYTGGVVDPGYNYINKLLILDASEVTIEEREAE